MNTVELRRLLIHIETHKTGTTSVQGALARTEIDGTLRPVRYPMPDGRSQIADAGQHWLAWSYLPYEQWKPNERALFPVDGARRAELLERYRRSLFGQLRTADRAVPSSEGFSWLPADSVVRLRKDLEKAGFREFRVAIYVRDPADYYLSATQEFLKMSGRMVSPIKFRYRFRSAIEAWEEAFPGCLVVRRFPGDPDFDVVQDFSRLTQEFLGMPLSSPRRRANTSVSAEGMEILHRYRSTFWPHRHGVNTPDSLRLAEFLRQSRTTVSQTRPELRPEIAAWIRAAHRDDLVFVAERYGLALEANRAAPVERPRLDQGSIRVTEVLRAIDHETVTNLLLLIAKAGMDRDPPKRALLFRIASRLSRLYQSGERTPRRFRNQR